jgi:hypothetical protein
MWAASSARLDQVRVLDRDRVVREERRELRPGLASLESTVERAYAFDR